MASLMLLICVSCLRAGEEAQEAYNHSTCNVKKMFSPWLALSRHAQRDKHLLPRTDHRNALTAFYLFIFCEESCALIRTAFLQRTLFRDKGEVRATAEGVDRKTHGCLRLGGM